MGEWGRNGDNGEICRYMGDHGAEMGIMERYVST